MKKEGRKMFNNIKIRVRDGSWNSLRVRNNWVTRDNKSINFSPILDESPDLSFLLIKFSLFLWC